MRPYLAILALAFAVVLTGAARAGEIHEAAKAGDNDKIRALVKANPELLRSKDEVGKTPLHWATGRDQPETIKMLVTELKIEVDIRNDNLGTPLHVAASQAKPECAKLLLSLGADVNARTKDQSTPLHFAAWKKLDGHLAAARVLLDAGADVNAVNQAGMTPLAMARRMGNMKTAQLLQERGGIVKTGNTAMRGRMGQGQGRQPMMPMEP